MLLGDEYTVIEEGCNGRTTIHDDPIDGWKKSDYAGADNERTHIPDNRSRRR